MPYAPAHTDGDVSVTFTDLDVIHLGDTWWNGHYPFAVDVAHVQDILDSER